MLVNILVWTAGVLILSLLWIKQRRDALGPPIYPGALPILGHSLICLGTCVELWEVFKKACLYTLEAGGIARMFVMTKPFYFIADIDDFTTIMTTCYDKSFIQDFVKEWIGDGLVTADAITWKKNRKLFGPAFTQRALVCFLDIFNNQSRKLVDELAAQVGQGEFDHHPYVVNAMLETVNQTTLGLKSEDNKMIDRNYVREIDTLLDMYVERFQKIWLYSSFMYNRSDLKKRQDNVINKAKAISYAVLKKRKLEYKKSKNICNDTVGEKGKTVVDYILENFVDNENFTDEDIREHLETFVFGSSHTTGTEMVFALKAIGANSEVQEQIYKELDEVFGESDRDVMKEDLSKLIYLEAVIKETVRLYPVVPIIARDTDVEVKLKNYTIPRGSTCIGCIYALNRHPAWGKDVDEFKPERWFGSNRPSDSSFTGFSIGRRNCIGTQYALIVMKTMLVHIFRSYRISAHKSEPVLKWNAYLRPVSGHHISLKSR